MNPQTQVLKTYYFVRHAVTEDNASGVYQGADDILTEKGRDQASLVANRLTAYTLDSLITSDYSRARITAREISDVNNLPLRESALFEEIRRPSELVGKAKSDESSQKIMRKIIEHEPREGWHYSDEENLFEAVARAREALTFLSTLPEKNIVVITHEMFTKILMSTMAQEEDEKAIELYRSMRYFMTGDNTGITVVEYGDFGSLRYKLRVWNDHTHLEG